MASRSGAGFMPIVPHAWRLHYLAPAVAVLGFVAAHGNREGAALGEDWARFRGPNGSGVSETGAISERLDPENTQWTVDGGRGTSSPIVVKQRLFLPEPAGE